MYAFFKQNLLTFAPKSINSINSSNMKARQANLTLPFKLGQDQPMVISCVILEASTCTQVPNAT